MSNRKNPYLFYTEYYIISGAYHIVNVVNDVLNYTASCSDHIKGYLQSKVINKKMMLNEIVYNNNVVVKNNDPDVDEDGFVVIKMRRPKIKNDSIINASNNTVINSTAVINSTDLKTTMSNTRQIILDTDSSNTIVKNILNDILNQLDGSFRTIG